MCAPTDVRIGFLLFASTTIRLSSQSQPHDALPSIDVNSYSIHMGAPIDVELGRFKKDYEVTLRDDGPGIMGYDISIRGGQRYASPLVSLWSTNGRVSGIEQLTEIETTDGMFDALFYMSSKVARENRGTCVMSTWTGSTGDLKVPLSKATVRLSCGPYSFTVLRNTFRSDGNALVSGYLIIQEVGVTH